jgi:spermidine synthase
VGSNVGRLISISTIGSFVGTMLIGYVMIPYLPNSVTMFFTSLLLMLICAVYFGFFRRVQVGPLALIFLLTLSSGFALRANLAVQPRRAIELFRGNSHFGQLQVLDLEDGSKRYYLNDFLVQNTYDPVQKQSMSQFTYMLAGLARAYTTNIHDALCIGLGVGIVPMDLARTGAAVDVVEINPAVVPVASKFFGLDTNKIHITIDDGRHFLNRCGKKYDAVVLDAFLGDSSPSHLLTREAFASIKHVLKPGGVLSINAFCSNEPGRDFFAASLEKTLKAVFEGVRIHGRDDGAFFFAASDHPLSRFTRQPNLDNVHPEVASELQESFEGIEHTTPDHGIVLTDNYNPVDVYDAKNREDLRKRLALDAQRL